MMTPCDVREWRILEHHIADHRRRRSSEGGNGDPKYVLARTEINQNNHSRNHEDNACMHTYVPHLFVYAKCNNIRSCIGPSLVSPHRQSVNSALAIPLRCLYVYTQRTTSNRGEERTEERRKTMKKEYKDPSYRILSQTSRLDLLQCQVPVLCSRPCVIHLSGWPSEVNISR